MMRKLLVLAVAGALAWYGYGKVKNGHGPEALSSVPATAQASPAAATARFRCDGRTHCSEMRSCEEATYFIKHCPNTKMDGDGDGVPCERQWCS